MGWRGWWDETWCKNQTNMSGCRIGGGGTKHGVTTEQIYQDVELVGDENMV